MKDWSVRLPSFRGPGDTHLHQRPGRGQQPAPDRGPSGPRQPPGAAVLREGGQVAGDPGASRPDAWIAAYLEGASLADAPKASPLFRTGERRGSSLTERAMSPLAVQLMLKRRLKAAGLPEILSPHSFRVLVVTDLFSKNVPRKIVSSEMGRVFFDLLPLGDSGDISAICQGDQVRPGHATMMLDKPHDANH